ncbi:MAG: hypothetical protein WBG18_07470 [Xanthobacteraceae bacterium]
MFGAIRTSRGKLANWSLQLVRGRLRTLDLREAKALLEQLAS